MHVIRFSLRRLLVLTTLVALVLYFLVRPSVVAKNFARRVENEAKQNPHQASREYFGFATTSPVTVTTMLHPRTWREVLTGRQRFTLEMITPLENRTDEFLVDLREYCGTHLGIRETTEPTTYKRLANPKTDTPFTFLPPR